MAKLHGMMMNKLMQMQAAGQHTDTEATSIPAVWPRHRKRDSKELHHQFKRNSPSARREINTNKKQMLRPLKLWQCQILPFNRSAINPPISSYNCCRTARLRARSNSQPRIRKSHPKCYRRQSLTRSSASLHGTAFRSRF